MSAIAYITDSRMLQMHRLNNHKTMNFWRLSNNINFSNFTIGDLVFFLSKDKEHKNKNEKGIVGFGRLKDISLGSVKSMWDKYGILNGYNTLEEFKEAILKVAKDKKMPRKISSFYLENVTFFQPIYLSECGVKISNNVESYIYIKPEEVTLKLLQLAKHSTDLWTNLGNEEAINQEELLYSLYTSHNKINDIFINKTIYNRSYRQLKKYLETNSSYEFIQNSKNELFRIKDKLIEILFYYDEKNIDPKLILGQADLYKYYITNYYGNDVDIKFYIYPSNDKIQDILNKNNY